MSVKILIGDLPSNKPPSPVPVPSKARYPFKPQLSLQHDVWVSIPQPDKITIIGEVRPEHFVAGFKPDSPAGYSQVLMSGLAEGHAGKASHVVFAKNIYWTVQILAGPEKSAVNFKIFMSKVPDAAHSLRIEMNPTAITSAGILDLLDKLHVVSGFKFLVGAFLADSKITRIDVAVDIVGLLVPELIVRAQGEGKRVNYYGQDGALESVYLHRKFKPHDVIAEKAGGDVRRQGLGGSLVRVYDKVRERQSVGRPPPFGPAPVSRIEVSRNRFGKKPLRLVDLPALANPFYYPKGKRNIAVGFSWSTPPEQLATWLSYVECRRGAGHDWASKVLRMSKSQSDKYDHHYRSYPSNVLDPKKVWAEWPKSLNQSGVGHLISAAEFFSKGSHIGDFEKKYWTDPAS